MAIAPTVRRAPSAGLSPASGSSATTLAPSARIAGAGRVVVGDDDDLDHTARRRQARNGVDGHRQCELGAQRPAATDSRVLAHLEPLDRHDDRPRLRMPALTSGILARCSAAQRDGSRLGFWYRLVVVVVKPLPAACSRTATGAAPSNIPREGGIIVAANHVSEVDPLDRRPTSSDDARPPPRFLAKSELFRKPPLKWILVGAQQIPVYRGTATPRARCRPRSRRCSAASASSSIPRAAPPATPRCGR